MSKFGYIINNSNNLINTFRIESICAKEFESIFSVQLSKNSKLKLFYLENNDLTIGKLSERIKHYLSVRNKENPDYNIDWIGRFPKNLIFIEEVVLGEKMELFQGNEDIIISFLARIENYLINNSTGLMYFLTDNDKEKRDFLQTNSI